MTIEEIEEKEIEDIIEKSNESSKVSNIFYEGVLNKTGFTDEEKDELFKKIEKVNEDSNKESKDTYPRIADIPRELAEWIVENLTQEFKDETTECDIKYIFCKIKNDLDDDFLEEMKGWYLVNTDNDLTTKGFLYILRIMKK